MGKLDLSQKNLKKFGITMGIAFLVITALILLRHKHSIKPTLVISTLFFISAFVMPIVLRPVYILWMKLAFILGWVNTRLILFIIFYLIFTPVGLALRLFGKDLLDRKIKEGKDSYWQKRIKTGFNPLDYERQF